MESVRLNNGVDLPLAGLGTWDLRGARCVEAVRAALDLGCRLIDTAQMYDNEAQVAVLLHGYLESEEGSAM